MRPKANDDGDLKLIEGERKGKGGGQEAYSLGY